MIKEKIEKILGREIVLVHPKSLDNGDYTLIANEKTAEEDFKKLNENKITEISKIDFVKPRFINFYLSKEFFKESLGEIIDKEEKFGSSEIFKGEKVMVEYTDPNPFKEFHIGHLMSNAIGESLSRIIEANGSRVLRANWQGDVGMHVAKAVWSMKVLGFSSDVSVVDLGKAYAYGAQKFEEENIKKEITEINKKVFSREDESVNKLYDLGKKVSLEYFETIYKKLGTKFDHYFFESREGVEGKPIVEKYLSKGIFEKSDGAIIFPGEKYGLHTRVFINSQGLPTYEAKELGLNKKKFEVEPDLHKSIIVTGNEIKEYFQVLLKVISLIYPEIAKKTVHKPHGMLRLPTGKMSSRTGDIITAEELIETVKKGVKGNEQVAIGAIKYMILRQAIGNDIIFDIDKSVSTEGDSGVYLQYAHARACSILEKAGQHQSGQHSVLTTRETHEVERLLYRFPEVVEKAGKEYAPHYITTYLTELASSFNNFYAHEQIINNSPESPYRLAIAKAFNIVMKNGLTILGIPTPERI